MSNIPKTKLPNQLPNVVANHKKKIIHTLNNWPTTNNHIRNSPSVKKYKHKNIEDIKYGSQINCFRTFTTFPD